MALDFNILTFQDSMNYGAMLQAYALQSFIEELNYSAGIYAYNRPPDEGGTLTFRASLSRVLRRFTYDQRSEDTVIKRFEEFRASFLNRNLSIDSRVFLSGSDQVWNCNDSLDPMFFLGFIGDKVVKASYAASMSKDVIPKDKTELVKRYLNTFDAISVREEDVKRCLTELCDKEINVNLDPTLLLDKHFYERIEKKVDNLPEHYILAYILHIPRNGNRLLRWLKIKTGHPVVLLDASGNVGLIIHNDVAIRNAGPREFLYLFRHANCVVTTSFHGTCFSLIFEKEFYSIVNPNSPGRISNLMNKVGLNPIKETDKVFSRSNSIDWERIRAYLDSERACSKRYIDDVFAVSKKKIVKPLQGTVVQMYNKCTGCAACEKLCHTDAISMKLNNNGFYEPIIDTKKCVQCGQCLQKCPLNNKLVSWPVKAYYGWSKFPDVLKNSSSGGAFYSIAQSVLNKNGVVFGAVYTSDWNEVVFECTDDIDLREMQKSKYTVSASSGVYDRIEKCLNDGRYVLFTGAPCQCAGVQAIFGSDKDRLITCDFVCGGMPSLTMYREHIEYLKNKMRARITSLDFRPKEWGWGRHRISATFSNDKKYVKRDFADAYFKCFIDKTSVRTVCHECPFYHFHRSDITIADFWGYKAVGIKKRRSGISMVICNTFKGLKLFNDVKEFEKNELPMEYTLYTVRERIPQKKKLEESKKLFALTTEKGFEKAAHEIYDLNVLRYYLRRIRQLF